MSIELKPCPFCGREAYLRDFGAGFYSVCCFNRACAMTCETPVRTSAEKAITDWNTRAERTCHIVKTWSDSDFVDGWRYRCSECMCFIPVNERDPETGAVISSANYCPNCGAKVMY